MDKSFDEALTELVDAYRKVGTGLDEIIDVLDDTIDDLREEQDA